MYVRNFFHDVGFDVILSHLILTSGSIHCPSCNEAFRARHYGGAIKAIINVQCGDGIMSAIDFYLDVGTTEGVHGETRVVITMKNGKFLPFMIEQKANDNTAKSPRI